MKKLIYKLKGINTDVRHWWLNIRGTCGFYSTVLIPRLWKNFLLKSWEIKQQIKNK